MIPNNTQIDAEQRSRFLAESIPQMVWTADPDGTIDYYNERWFSYTGLSLEASRGWGWQAAVHPDDLNQTIDRWKKSLTTGQAFEIENRFKRAADGAYRWHLSRAFPVRDAQDSIVKWFGTCTDIDDQKRSGERFRFVAEASRLLGLSLDYETTLRKITRFIVPYLADWCSIDLADKNGSFKQLIVAHVDPAKIAFAREVSERFPADPNAPYGIYNVLRTGQSEIVSQITDDMLVNVARDPAHLEMLRALHMSSSMTVPLLSRGRVLGALSLVAAESDRHYDAADLALAEDLARRVAIAVDNAQLYSAAQQELTVRKQVELELKRSRDQLEAILHSVADGITVQDTSGKVVFTNEVAAHIAGYASAQDLQNAPADDFGARYELRDENDQVLPLTDIPGRRALQEGQASQATVLFRELATGAERWLVIKSTPVSDSAGVTQFAVTVTQDISEVKRAEQAIRVLNQELEQRVVERTSQLGKAVQLLQDEIAERKRAQQALHQANDQLEMRVRERTADLKAANDELSTFTYIVSHDLRAPLVNLKGFAAELKTAINTIQDDLAVAIPTLPLERQENLKIVLQTDIPEALEFINSSVTRMDHLTSAVLRLSRLGRRELSMERIDVQPLVQTILNSLAHQIKQQNVTVTVEELPPVVADRMSMEQIMANLLTNALLYLKPDCPGEIAISGEQDASGAMVTFHIRDNGRGIAEEDRHKIFEPFRRAGRQDVPGEGMGLAFVQAMVRRHGGRIWYNSKLGEGTTFTFTILNNVLGNGH